MTRRFGAPRRSRTLVRTLVGVTALALTATTAACSDESSGASGSTILNVAGAPTGPLQRNFNPFLTTGPMNLIGGVSIINEPLFIPSAIDVGKTTPWLAKSWRFSADGRELTLDLQSGVKWTDGRPFTAEDVAFTFTMLQKNPAMNVYGLPIASARAEGPDKAVVTFPVPSFAQEAFLGATYIVPKHVWEAVPDPASFTNENPVGTGPFMLDTWSPQGYLLKRNPNYWQPGKPRIDGLRYVVHNSNVSANLALAQGQLDWAANFVNNIEKEYLDKDRANNKHWSPPIAPTYLGMNLTKPQYRNADVRRAISLALDREKLVEVAEQNQQPANTTPTGLVFPQHERFVAAKYKDQKLRQDIPAAKALMEKAGYRIGGDGYAVGPDGRRFTMTLLTSSGFTDIITMYQLMTDQLKQIGIEVNIETKATGEFIANQFTGNFDASTVGPLTGSYSPFHAYERTLAGYLTQDVGKPAFANQVRWKDAKTDQLLQQYAASQDPAVRQAALEGLQDIMVEQVPVIPLFNFVSWAQYNTRKVVGWPDAGNPYATATPVGPGSVLVATSLEPKAE
ncbi:ABC transporter substrate-binding protein [Yinghuangia sp. YIM S09857]|uniref:ABC transporter substrate-binding protein n=1 Tax=Yinghuangia sp. YIM S09857 TaxID=3436929 RepID=UPI003F52BAA3